MSFSSDRPFGTRPPSTQADWQSTRLQTQISPRLDPLEEDDEHDIGRAVGDGTRELFVACEPADALIQQFDHLQPEFIAVHDLGVAVSLKLLAGIAAAGQQPLQRLLIRRNGAGTVLATLQFVDCPAANGRMVRIYSTQVDGDTRTRQAINRVLLGRSRLGIVMVGDLPAHGLQAALAPWREASLQVGWLCRRMLFMPLLAHGALPAELARFRAATVIDVSLMPQVAKPADVWSQMCTAWNTLQRQSKPGLPVTSLAVLGGPAAVRATAALDTAPGRLMPPRTETPAYPSQPEPGASSGAPAGLSSGAAAMAAAVPIPPTPMPVIGAQGPLNDEPLEHYLHDLSQIAGVVSACAFDIMTGRPVGHSGARPGPDELARQGSAILATMMSASRSLGLGSTVPETAITLGQHHLLLRAMPAHPGMALHLVLDKPHVTLALVQMQLRRLDEALIIAVRITPSATAPSSR